MWQFDFTKLQATTTNNWISTEKNSAISGGRLRDMIIRGGENIYPAEIENLLQIHPAIEQVSVFGVEDDYYGETVAAAVVTGADVTARELQDYCSGRLAKFKVPSVFYKSDGFPLTPSGKVRKDLLRARFSQP